MNSNTYNNGSAGDRWMEIASQLQVAAQMYSQIKSIPAAAKVIPNPWSPTLKIQEVKQKAAEEYYNQGPHEVARYSGYKEALEASDRSLINNTGTQRPPLREELAERLVNNCYNQLLSRIRSGVSF